MKIVKGDIVYIRAGRDAAGQARLRDALDMDKADEATFQSKRAAMPMPDQIAEANKVKGVRGEVIRVLPEEGKVVVRGKNMVTKHQKPRASTGAAQIQQGGRIEMEAPLPVSRVMLVCPHCDKPTRVGTKIVGTRTLNTVSGTRTQPIRERVCKQCGEIIERPTTHDAQARGAVR
jgi:large subunit ribosomal protein L24